MMNNTTASLALGELNKNNNKLSKDLQKLSSGMRFSGPGGNAAEYAISERMRVMVRSLGQDMENVKTGKNLVHTAEDGIQRIIDELRDMKAMAINSLNDHNSEIDRHILQKEFSERMQDMEDIAVTTNYNGIILLDGRWHEGSSRTREITQAVTRTEYYIEYESDPPTDPGSSSGTGGSGGTGGTEGTGSGSGTTPLPTSPVRPTSETVTMIPSGDYTISTDGVYKISNGYSGTITITAKNVELQQEGVLVRNGYIECANDHTNLWVNNLNMGTYMSAEGAFVEKNIIKFTGTGNTVNIIGYNQFDNNASKNKAVVNVGGGVTFYDGDSTGTNTFYASSMQTAYQEGAPQLNLGNGAAIGSDAGQQSTGYIVVNGGNVSGHIGFQGGMPYGNDRGFYGAGIGSGKGGSIGMIAVNGGSLGGTSGFGAGIGSGYGGTVRENIVIRDGTVTGYVIDHKNQTDRTKIVEHSAGAAIGAGENGKVLGDIIIKGGTVNAWSYGQGAGIGTGGYEQSKTSSVGNIVIKNSTVNAFSKVAEAVGHGSLDLDDHTSLDSGGRYNADGSIIYERPEKIESTTGTISVYGGSFSERTTMNQASGSVYHVYKRSVSDRTGADAPDGDTGDPPESKFSAGEPSEPEEPPVTPPEEPSEPRPVTKSRIVTDYITKSVSEGLPGNPIIIHTGPKANQDLRVFINNMRPKAMGLSDVAIDPVELAREALEKLDSALNYALNENTRMGAYQIRLDETLDTLISRHENSVSSESVIRDADMAKEAMNFFKDNVLTQASEAMLAQANQNSNAVLSLLQ